MATKHQGDSESSPLLGDQDPYHVTGVTPKRSRCRSWLPLVVTLVALVLAVIIGLVLGLGVLNDVTTVSATGYYRNGAVATDAGQCSEIGSDVLKRNGSAVDAAIASVLCVGLHNTQSCGVGGGDVYVIYDTPRNATQRVMTVLDSREVAPLAATANMSAKGILSVGVPGNILGLYEAWKRFGRLPWESLFEPTIKLCRDGFTVGMSLGEHIKDKESDIRQNPQLKEIFVKADDSLYQEGDTMTRPKLARTLETVSADPTAFYTGQLAEDIVTDIQEQGGIVTLEDLRSYRVKWREPIKTLLEGSDYTVHTAPPPFGGIIYQYILKLMESYQMAPFSSSSTEFEILRYHRIAEAFKFGFASRTFLGDPDFTDQSQLLANLTSRDYIGSIREKITDDVTHDISYYQPNYGLPRDKGTSHLSVLAPDGAAVSVTATINSYFGSKCGGARTGIIFNNEMSDFNSPDDVISGDLRVAANNLIEPGKRPVSSMTPAIILNDSGDVIQVIGAAGSEYIITGTALSSMSSLFYEVKVNEAIDRRRTHHELSPNVLWIEEGFSEDVVDGLRKKGHVIKRFSKENIVQGVQSYCHEPDHSKDCIMAVSDWRKKGRPSGF